MLEFERQARYPKDADERLVRYRRYFQTELPEQDHGTTPYVLFVFPTGVSEDRFTDSLAGEEGLPVLTSNMDLLEDRGVLSTSWRRLWTPSEDTRVAL